MPIGVTGDFVPLGSFKIIDGKNIGGAITGSDISASNNLFISTSLSSSHTNNNVLLVNTSTGELYHTGSYGSGGSTPTPTLQQVMDQGSITTVAITASADISSSANIEAADGTFSADLTAKDDIFVGDKIMHFGDTSTLIGFQTDFIALSASRFEFGGAITASSFISTSFDVKARKFQVDDSVFAEKNSGKIFLGEVGSTPLQIHGQEGIEIMNPLTGSIISASEALFISTSLSASHTNNNVLLVNTSTGELYHTGSYGSGGGGTIPTLQQVMDQGSITTVAITASADISASGDLKGNELVVHSITDANPGATQFSINTNGFATFDSLTIGGTVNLNGTSNNYGNGATDKHTFTGNITASNDISASGDVFANEFVLQDEGVLSAASTTFNIGSTSRKMVYKGISHTFANAITSSTDISSSGQLSAATVTGFITGDSNNRVLTSNGDGTFTAQDSLTYNGTTFALQTQNIDMQADGGGFDLTGNITASGNISSSNNLFASTSLSESHASNNVLLVNTATGELYHTGSYGSGGGGGGGVVTGYTNGSNNRVITSTGASTINGEGGLLFDTTTNLLQVGVSTANRVTLSGASGTVQTSAHVTIGDNSANTNVNAFLQFAPKSGGYYSGVFISTDDMVSTFSADGRHTGEIIEAPVASSITAGDILFMRTTGGGVVWNQANASAQASSVTMLAIGIDTATTNRAMSRGYVRVAATQVLGPTPDIGQLLYISTGSSGAFQTLPPKTVGHVVRSVGYPINSLAGRAGSILSYLIYFNPSNDYIIM